ncbi:MAG TPA: ABC transporter permease, partial [Spirochaetia bacterium]|nr:ABC transporter permease [Spirochaetia bacterium]
MKTHVTIALRNLTRQKKRTALLAIAIAFSVMIVTVIYGLTSAISVNIAENFSDILGGHIFITGSEKHGTSKEISRISNDQALRDALKASGINYSYVSSYSSTFATIIFEGKTTSLLINGINIKENENFRKRLSLKKGDWESILTTPNALIVPEKVAQTLNVEIGDVVIAKIETVYGQNNVGEFRIAGINYNADLVSQLSSYTHTAHLNEILGLLPGEYQTFAVRLPSLKETDAAAMKYYDVLKNYVQVF